MTFWTLLRWRTRPGSRSPNTATFGENSTMIAMPVIDEIRRMLGQRRFSQRKIARQELGKHVIVGFAEPVQMRIYSRL